MLSKAMEASYTTSGTVDDLGNGQLLHVDGHVSRHVASSRVRHRETSEFVTVTVRGKKYGDGQ